MQTGRKGDIRPSPRSFRYRQRKRYSTVFLYLRNRRRRRASFIQRMVQNDSSEEAKKATCSLIAFVFGCPEPGRTEVSEIYQGGQRKRHERPYLLFVASLRHGILQYPFLGATDQKMPPGEARERDIRDAVMALRFAAFLRDPAWKRRRFSPERPQEDTERDMFGVILSSTPDFMVLSIPWF